VALPVGASKYTFADELAEKAFNEWSNKAAQASLDLGQGARFNQQAADALRSVGIKPLEGESTCKNVSMQLETIQTMLVMTYCKAQLRMLLMT